MSKAFQIDFDVKDYLHLFPEFPPSEEIINYYKDIDECVWARQVPLAGIFNMDFFELEVKRIRQGAFIIIKDQLLWLPPQYYFFLQYGTVKGFGSRYAEFRLKKLKEYYFKEECRRNINCLGSYIVKNRRDGTTTNVMSDCLWEMQKGIHTMGQIGIQSRTNDDAYDPCYTTLKAHFNGLPKEIRHFFYKDVVNPANIETRLRFESPGENGRNVFAKYYPSGNTAMDGKEMILCVLDEVNKWDENSLLETEGTYRKFILEGVIRKGLFVMFSSPSETNGRPNDEAYKLWQISNTNDLQPNGTTKSRIHAYRSHPLEGITGLFDKYGDADPNQVYDHIMTERKNAPNKLNEIRGFPLNDEEAFGMGEVKTQWDNHKGLAARKLYLSRTVYKDEATKEPKIMWGNLEWKNGIVDSEVIFRPNEKNEFNLDTGRICFSELPQFNVPLSDIRKPPLYIDTCLGVDPYHLGKGTKSGVGSSAGACNYKFRALADFSFVPHPTAIYNCRPKHIYTFFEDMLKICVYTRSMMQYEKSIDEIERYFDERGYGDWVLNPSPKEGEVRKITRAEISRGKGGGAFMNEVLSLVNILTNVPVNPEDPYPLEYFWFEELIDEIITLNRDNTTSANIFMGFGQAVIGAAKICNVRERERRPEESSMITHLLS